jgi:hypothetical protein
VLNELAPLLTHSYLNDMACTVHNEVTNIPNQPNNCVTCAKSACYLVGIYVRILSAKDPRWIMRTLKAYP